MGVLRGRGMATIAVVLAVLTMSTAAACSSNAKASNSGLAPVVQHTGKASTGYTVTFRYRAPAATKVQIEGGWFFSSPGFTTIGTSECRPASQWEPGDVAINPNAPQDILARLKST